MNHKIEEMRELLMEIERQVPKLCRNSKTQGLGQALKNVLPSLKAIVAVFGDEANERDPPDAITELLTHLKDFKSKLEQDHQWIET